MTLRIVNSRLPLAGPRDNPFLDPAVELECRVSAAGQGASQLSCGTLVENKGQLGRSRGHRPSSSIGLPEEGAGEDHHTDDADHRFFKHICLHSTSFGALSFSIDIVFKNKLRYLWCSIKKPMSSYKY